MPELVGYPFRPGGGPLLVGVHGAGGMLFLGKLAGHICGDVDYLALQGKAMDSTDGNHGFKSLVEVGDMMAEQIGMQAQHRPVCIFGRNSYFLLQVAYSLESRGITPRATVAVDSIAPVFAEPMQPAKHPLQPAINQLRRLLRVPDHTGLGDWVKPNLNPSGKTNTRQRVFRAINHQLLDDWKPRQFQGRTILLRSEEFSLNPDKIRHIETWSAIAQQLEIYVLPGTHRTLWNQPHVRALGAMLSRIACGAGEQRLLELELGYSGSGL